MIIIKRILETKSVTTKFGPKPKQVVETDSGKTLDYWGDDLKEGDSIDGEIVPASNDKYNATLKRFKTTFKATSTKQPDFGKIMEKKEASISRAQDNKFDSIKRAGSITNANNLLIAMLNNPKLELAQPLLTTADVHRMLESEIAYFEGLYDKENPPF